MKGTRLVPEPGGAAAEPGPRGPVGLSPEARAAERAKPAAGSGGDRLTRQSRLGPGLRKRWLTRRLGGNRQRDQHQRDQQNPQNIHKNTGTTHLFLSPFPFLTAASASSEKRVI